MPTPPPVPPGAPPPAADAAPAVPAGLAALTLNDGLRRLAVRPGLTVYAACRVNGVLVATGCGAQGRCGLCRLRVDRGDAGEPTEAERAKLTDGERAAGLRLACQVRVRGDLAVTLPAWTFAARAFATAIEEVEPLTHDIRRLRMRLAADASLAFTPGQFVAFAVKPASGRPGGTRCYSFASDPAEAARPGGFFDLIVRHVPGGAVSGWVMDAEAGTPVVCAGPYGDFRLTDGDRDAVFVAGGSGLSPFFAMLPAMRDDAARRAGAGRPPRRAALFFGAQSARDLYRIAEWRAFERENPWFTLWPVVQDGAGGPDTESGLVTEALARRGGDLSNADAYLCGSPGMIRACEGVLARLGLPAGQAYYDRF